MAATEQSVEKSTPPYMSFSRFLTFIGSLAGKPLPPRVDRTLMSKMSGGDQSQVRIALKFLNLAHGEEFLVTEALRELVRTFSNPPSDEFRGQLAKVIAAAYAPITVGLDENATQGMLDEAFRKKGGLSGSSLLKSVRFYLGAATAAGLPVSVHWKGASAATINGDKPKRPRKPRAAAPGEGGPAKDKSEENPPEDMDAIVVPIPGKSVRVWLPSNLTESEFAFVLQTLKTWRKLKAGN